MGQIISQSDLILQRRVWKGNGQSVVFVSGCFDLLHPGHIRLLEQARSYGDVLVVGVKSDASVLAEQHKAGSENSGESRRARPITPASERIEILSELAAVDYVLEFEGSSANELIAKLSPEILVETASQSPSSAPPRQAGVSENRKTRIVRILREPGYSTEQLLNRISQRPA